MCSTFYWLNLIECYYVKRKPSRMLRVVLCLYFWKKSCFHFGSCVCLHILCEGASLHLSFSYFIHFCWADPRFFFTLCTFKFNFTSGQLIILRMMVGIRISHIVPICLLHRCFNWISGFRVSNVASVCVRTRLDFKIYVFRQVVELSSLPRELTGWEIIYICILAKTFLNEQYFTAGS